MWCLRMARRWRGLLRRWRMKSESTAPRGDYAGAIAETTSGEWLVSVRESANAKFALKLWTPGCADDADGAVA